MYKAVLANKQEFRGASPSTFQKLVCGFRSIWREDAGGLENGNGSRYHSIA